jgi:heme exporter protein B
MNGSIWMAMVIILEKDLRTELHNPYNLNILIMFAITSLAVVSFSLRTPLLSPELLGPLLWIILFYVSVVGLGSSFVREEEGKTMDGLLLAAPVEGIFLGKTAHNFFLLLLAQVVVIPLYLLFFNLEVIRWGSFLITQIVASLGLALSSTLIAALISRAQGRGPLLAVLSFPMVFPLLIGAINGTVRAFSGEDGPIVFLLFYSLVVAAVALLLVDYIWEE